MAVNPIAEGFHGVTPHLVIDGAAEAIEFYKKALDAEEISRMPMPSGKLGHAELMIGGAVLMLADEFPETGAKSPLKMDGHAVILHVYVPDVDAQLEKVVAAGGEITMPPEDQFWGDRYAKFTDPFGHKWSLATRVKEMSPEEMAKAAEEAFAQMG